jgi:hypothetical protein
MSEKFVENLAEAERIIKAVDHMTYVTFPLIKEKKLLIKILEEINKAVVNCVSSMLQYEYLHKRIKLSQDARLNLLAFTEKSYKNFNITPEEVKQVVNLLELIEKRKKSQFEFMKGERVILLSEHMGSDSVDLDKVKGFLIMAKSILQKTRNTIMKNK